MKNRKAFPGIFSSIGILILLYIAMGLFSLIHSYTASDIFNVPADSFASIAILTVFSFAAVIFPGYILGRRSARTVFPVKAPSPLLLLYSLILTIGLVILLSEVDNIIRNNVSVPDFFSQMLLDLLTGNTVFQTALLIGVIAPITEELLFRGVILNGLVQRHTRKTAILVSALLFSLFHINPLQMTGAFIAGIFLAWILLKTDNILYAIYIHAVFNLFPLIILRLTPLQIEGFTDLNHPSSSYQPLWFDLGGAVLCIIGFWLTRNYITKHFPEKKPLSETTASENSLQES